MDWGPVRGVASGESGLRDIAGGGMLLFWGVEDWVGILGCWQTDFAMSANCLLVELTILSIASSMSV